MILPWVFQGIQPNAKYLFTGDIEENLYRLESHVPISYSDALPRTCFGISFPEQRSGVCVFPALKAIVLWT